MSETETFIYLTILPNGQAAVAFLNGIANAIMERIDVPEQEVDMKCLSVANLTDTFRSVRYFELQGPTKKTELKPHAALDRGGILRYIAEVYHTKAALIAELSLEIRSKPMVFTDPLHSMKNPKHTVSYRARIIKGRFAIFLFGDEEIARCVITPELIHRGLDAAGQLVFLQLDPLFEQCKYAADLKTEQAEMNIMREMYKVLNEIKMADHDKSHSRLIIQNHTTLLYMEITLQRHRRDVFCAYRENLIAGFNKLAMHYIEALSGRNETSLTII